MSAVTAVTAVPTGHVLHIVVRVGAERFAFPVTHVEEALDAPAIEPVPAAPVGMLGQMAHRGRTLATWDAAWALGLARPVGSMPGAVAALVLRDGSRRVALVVDDVVDMARIDAADVHGVPGGADVDGVLSGVCFPDGAASLVSVVRVESLAARVSSRGTFVDGLTT